MLGTRMLQAAAASEQESYRSVVLASLLVAYYRFGESSGTSAVDVIGGTSGTYVGGVSLGEGGLINSSDTAVDLDGTSGYITLDGLTYDPQSSFSLEFWYRTPSALRSTVLETLYAQRNGTGTGRTWIYIADNGTNEVSSFLKGVSNGLGVTLDADTTYYFVFRYDHTTNTASFFYKGLKTAEFSITPESATGGHVVGVTKNLNASFGQGIIDELAFYSHTLTPTEIRRHYWAGKGKTGYELEVLASGPEAYYRLGESSGTVAADVTGNHPATYVGGVGLGVDSLISASDTAVLMDGSSSYIDLNTLTFDPSSGDFAVEIWYRTPVTLPTGLDSEYTCFSQRDGSGTGRSWLLLDNPNASGYGAHRLVSFLGGAGKDLGVTATTNTLYHLVLCYGSTAGEISAFVNGVLTATVAVAPESATGGLVIGAQKLLNKQFLGGVIDEAAVYKRALTPTEISSHYSAGSGT